MSKFTCFIGTLQTVKPGRHTWPESRQSPHGGPAIGSTTGVLLLRAMTVAIFVGACFSGCASSFWTLDATPAKSSTASAASDKPPAAPAAPSTTSASLQESSKTAAAESSTVQPDAITMQDIMAEVHKVGEEDPAACAKLTKDMQQTDPSLWPLVMKQFRATQAYRRRAASQNAAVATNTATPPAAQPASPPATPQPTAPQLSPSLYLPLSAAEASTPWSGAADVALTASAGQSSPPAPSGVTVAQYPLTPQSAPALQQATPDPVATSSVQPTVYQLAAEAEAARSAQHAQAGAANNVLPASYAAPVSGAPQPSGSVSQQRLAEAITAWERELPQHPNTPADAAQYARLRLLYLAAGRNLDALQLVPANTAAAQEFWLQEMAGLTAYLDVTRLPDDAARAAEAKPLLAEAAAKLGVAANLVVRNLSFCKGVQSYGSLMRFDKNEFTPEQEVLLYAEVDNFVSEPGANDYHTSLQSKYRIVDAAGKEITTQSFSPTNDHCQSLRRDFFIGYRLRIPKDIQPGKYVLQLVIEDTKGHKSGQASIEFVVKEGEKKDGKPADGKKPEGGPPAGGPPSGSPPPS